MEFYFTEEQNLIRSSAKDFLKKECSSDLVREMEEDDKGYSPGLWRKMAELGWLGLIFPIEYGGFGGNFLDLTILLEEMGRYLVPVPFFSTVILGGLSIFFAGNEKQNREFLPKIAKGELILTMALTEVNSNYESTAINLRALRNRDYLIVDGTKLFVPFAHVADYLVCVVRSKDGKKKDDGITLCLIDGKNPKIKTTVLKTIACDKQCEVIFNRAEVSFRNVLGQYEKGWEVIRKVLEHAALAQCALMIGGAEKVLEMTVDYAKKRVQFGRLIGSFQAIQHKCANMVADLDAAKLVTYEAAWKLSQGLTCTLEISIAKAWANEACRRICANGHQVHGGVGVMREHDMELYSRRAKAAEFFWGDTNFHREIVAQQLGL